MKILSDIKLDFSDVLILPKRSTLSSRSEPNILRKYNFKNGQTLECVPIICSNMDTIGNFAMGKKLMEYKMLTILHKHYPVTDLVDYFAQDSNLKEFVGISFGIGSNDLKKLDECCSKIDFKILCIDVANGYSQNFLEKVKLICERYGKTKIIMAGNIVTASITEELSLIGVDVAKIGIGSGVSCTTRRITGCGYPQLSSVIECSDASHGLHKFICSDGGCTTPACINKALAAGSDFVMIGGMLSATDLSSGEIIEENGQKFKMFYGMSSETAMVKHYGKKESYRAAEGKTMKLPYKGKVDDIVEEILGGLRSMMTYIGAREIKQISKCATFIRVNNQYNTSYNNFVTK